MNEQYKTMVVGASLKPYRYSHRAVRSLKLNDYEVIPLGLSKGEIDGIKILNGEPEISDIHTVSMYLNADPQPPLYDYILGLNPKRIIFNPGAENSELYKMASEKGILCDKACTLVLLST